MQMLTPLPPAEHHNKGSHRHPLCVTLEMEVRGCVCGFLCHSFSLSWVMIALERLLKQLWQYLLLLIL